VTTPAEEPGSVSVLRSEQRLRITNERVTTETISVRRRVVSETRQVSVTVRREELVIERTPTPDSPVDPVPAPPAPLVVVLHEEVPVVQMSSRPYEQVTITVEQVTSEQTITAELDHEQVEVHTGRPGPQAPL